MRHEDDMSMNVGFLWNEHEHGHANSNSVMDVAFGGVAGGRHARVMCERNINMA